MNYIPALICMEETGKPTLRVWNELQTVHQSLQLLMQVDKTGIISPCCNGMGFQLLPTQISSGSLIPEV